MQKLPTFLLYFAIWLITYLIASLSTMVASVYSDGNKIVVKDNWGRLSLFCVTFFILWFFYICTDISKDYYTYVHIFNNVTWRNLSELGMESGFEFLNLLIRLFTNSGHLAVATIKTLILLIPFYVIAQFRNTIDIGTAVLAYVSLSYLSSLNLISLHLAAVITLLGLRKLISNKRISCFIYLLVASTVHYSAILIIVVFFSYLFTVDHKRQRIYPYRYAAVCIFLMGSLFFVPSFSGVFLRYIPVFQKYTSYLSDMKHGFGLVQIFYYLPVFLSLRIAYSLFQNRSMINVSLVWATFGFFFALLGYQISIIDRMFVYFTPVHFLFIAYYVQQIKTQNIDFSRSSIRSVFAYDITALVVLLYYLVRFLLYLYVHMNISGLNQYSFIWQ